MRIICQLSSESLGIMPSSRKLTSCTNSVSNESLDGYGDLLIVKSCGAVPNRKLRSKVEESAFSPFVINFPSGVSNVRFEMPACHYRNPPVSLVANMA